MDTISLHIDGMSCGHCVASCTDATRIAQAIEEAGYAVRPETDS